MRNVGARISPFFLFFLLLGCGKKDASTLAVDVVGRVSVVGGVSGAKVSLFAIKSGSTASSSKSLSPNHYLKDLSSGGNSAQVHELSCDKTFTQKGGFFSAKCTVPKELQGGAPILYIEATGGEYLDKDGKLQTLGSVTKLMGVKAGFETRKKQVFGVTPVGTIGATRVASLIHKASKNGVVVKRRSQSFRDVEKMKAKLYADDSTSDLNFNDILLSAVTTAENEIGRSLGLKDASNLFNPVFSTVDGQGDIGLAKDFFSFDSNDSSDAAKLAAYCAGLNEQSDQMAGSSIVRLISAFAQDISEDGTFDGKDGSDLVSVAYESSSDIAATLAGNSWTDGLELATQEVLNTNPGFADLGMTASQISVDQVQLSPPTVVFWSFSENPDDASLADITLGWSDQTAFETGITSYGARVYAGSCGGTVVYSQDGFDLNTLSGTLSLNVQPNDTYYVAFLVSNGITNFGFLSDGVTPIQCYGFQIDDDASDMIPLF